MATVTCRCLLDGLHGSIYLPVLGALDDSSAKVRTSHARLGQRRHAPVHLHQISRQGWVRGRRRACALEGAHADARGARVPGDPYVPLDPRRWAVLYPLAMAG